ncbi:MAG: glycosyltransferase family 2 protein [Prochloraceae cyanobacterium]|nr:glycosyltransferase family 2 protein [Prochloraceae cyanobacterium]
MTTKQIEDLQKQTTLNFTATTQVTAVEEFPQDVSVAIVTHNALSYLAATLESLKAAGCPNEQITIVDVASTDGGTDWVESQWSGVRVLRLDFNKGPNPARNLGITSATTPYVLIMDADVMVQANTVFLLRTAMKQDPSIAIASPIVVYANKPDTIQYAGTSLHFMCEAVNPWQGKPVYERGTEPQDIGCASGCTLLISRAAAIRAGLFDNRYFAGKDDGDFTHRIKLAGYRIIEVPTAHVIHNCSPRGTKLFQHQIRNRWHFMLKNYQIRTLLLLAPILLLHELLQITLLTYKGHSIAYLKAILNLIKMLPSLPSDRASVAKFRVRQDHEVLISSPILVREDMLSNSFLCYCKTLYDSLLSNYWKLLRKTILK